MKELLVRTLIRLCSSVAQAVRGWRALPDPRSVHRIVVLQMSGVGDLLLITPALRALHRLYPEARIDLITYKLENAVFLFRLPYMRRGCEFPLFELELRRIWTPAFWLGLDRPIRFLRQEPCDLYVSFHHTWLSQWYLFELWVAARSGARFAVGINPDCVAGSGVFDRALPESQLGDRHYRPLFLEVVGLVGEAGNDLATEFPLEPAEIQQARDQVRQAMPDRHRMVCLHVGATHAAQLWPIERFLDLARRLQAEGDGIVLIGTKEERSLTEQLAGSLPPGAVLNVAGMTDLFQMAAFIDVADLFIGNDSGPMHVAIARRRPTIGLIGPGRTRYHRYAPDEAVILKNPLPFDIRDRKDAAFPWAITVDEVYAAARNLLP
ncbi:MAG: glycosyltransferase family 9 protein [Nitrospirae bacterium]|nr:MAG: glycosyltransferase family 9 protein [Nitrospirota bacterium]